MVVVVVLLLLLLLKNLGVEFQVPARFCLAQRTECK